MTEASYQSYAFTANLLSEHGIPVPPAEMVASPDTAAAAWRRLDQPVALKIISQAASHKSDRGLLALNLNREELIRQEAQTLFMRADGIPIEGLLVQAMAPPGVEVLAGLKKDPHFGMMLVFGAGGTLVELMDQVTLRKTPVTAAEILWLLKQHPLYQLLKGYRGKPAGDTLSLARMLENLGRLGHKIEPELDSLDINPVIVSPNGVHVVDFRLRMKGGPA